jgi:hypothetical protein
MRLTWAKAPKHQLKIVPPKVKVAKSEQVCLTL